MAMASIPVYIISGGKVLFETNFNEARELVSGKSYHFIMDYGDCLVGGTNLPRRPPSDVKRIYIILPSQ